MFVTYTIPCVLLFVLPILTKNITSNPSYIGVSNETKKIIPTEGGNVYKIISNANKSTSLPSQPPIHKSESTVHARKGVSLDNKSNEKNTILNGKTEPSGNSSAFSKTNQQLVANVVAKLNESKAKVNVTKKVTKLSTTTKKPTPVQTTTVKLKKPTATFLNGNHYVQSNSALPDYISTHLKMSEIVEKDKSGHFNYNSDLESYVVVIVAVVAVIPLCVLFLMLISHFGFDWWGRRHYRRMDYLIEGMYNA